MEMEITNMAIPVIPLLYTPNATPGRYYQVTCITSSQQEATNYLRTNPESGRAFEHNGIHFLAKIQPEED